MEPRELPPTPPSGEPDRASGGSPGGFTTREEWPEPSADARPEDARPEDARPEDDVARRRGSRWLRWMVLLLPVLLVAGPIAVGEFPREVALWHGAAALEHHLDGDPEQALKSLNAGLAWDPDNVLLLLQRSEWRLDAGDEAGALADAEEALEVKSEYPAAHFQRSVVLQKMGRHADAVEAWDKLVELADGATRVSLKQLDGTRRIDVYNGRAYARAVANLQIPEALEDVGRSIDRLGENVAVLDTRGFLRYRAGDHQSARDDLDKAVADAESYYEQVLRVLRDVPAARRAPDGRDLPVEREEAEEAENSSLGARFLDLRELRRFREEAAELVAVTRYHRALALQELGEAEAARADLERVREMGFEPGPDLY